MRTFGCLITEVIKENNKEVKAMREVHQQSI